jgi:hypothetical protein
LKKINIQTVNEDTMAVVSEKGAVRYFSPDHPDLPRHVLGKLKKEYEQLAGAVADGCGVDYADYRYRVGMLHGLKLAMMICEEEEEALRE